MALALATIATGAVTTPPASGAPQFRGSCGKAAGPVVDGEWTNYEPAPTSYPTGPRSSCWPDAPSRVPEYLRYLARLDVGLNAYQLQPGYLIKSYSNLGDPTTINDRTWSCTSDAEAQPGQGVGYLLLTWFEQRND